MGRRIAIIFIGLLTLVAAGCSGARETDQIAFVMVVGVDRNENNKLEFTFQIAVPRSFGAGNSSGPKDVKEATELLTVEAESFAEARDLANSTVARILSLAHVKGFVLGEKVAREGVEAVLPALTRFREYRGSMFLMVTREGTAKEFITNNQPKLEVSPARYLETIMASSRESSNYLPTTVHQYYVRLKNGGGEPYVTLVASRENKESDHRKSKQSIDRTGDYSAGDLPRSGPGNPSEFLGVAVFRGDKMVGHLDNKQTRGLTLIEGKFERGFFSVADPLIAGQTVNLEVEQGGKPRIKASMIDGKASFLIDVFIEAEITAIGSGVHYEAGGYREQLEAQVSKVVAEDIRSALAVTQPLGSDVGGLSCRLWPKFDTYRELSQVDWAELYRNADIDVAVVTKIRRTGFMTKTSPDHLNRQEE